MDAGGLAHMSPNNFPNGLPDSMAHPQFAMGAPGLASRRGGQNIKPLSFDTLRASAPADKDTVPTPRTSRGHLLAGLRTAPKSATAATFPASPTVASPTTQMFGRNNIAQHAGYGSAAQYNAYNGPKTAMPRYAGGQPTYNNGNSMAGAINQRYTPEQVLAPPQIRVEEMEQDPQLYAQLVAMNTHLAQQQHQLQQQLLNIQAAAQQLNLNPTAQQQYQQQQLQQQQFALYQQQQQQMRTVQQQMAMSAAVQQPSVYAYVDPTTGQTFLLDQSAATQMQQSAYAAEQSAVNGQAYQQTFQTAIAPRVQVSPPPEAHASPFRSNSPPKRYDSPAEPIPLPPPSANAFRRGHKKSSSLAVNSALTVSTQDVPKSAGPKSAVFPLTPLTGGYGPGQGRAGEHPVRQPRGPPSLDELKTKPTAKHEGAKNFSHRTRRSAVHNLVRAGLERRKGSGSSSGSMSPVSESADESATPITDNESDSGRSGSGSLSGDMECSGAATTGAWGAIGSNRPNSRQNARKSVDSVSSDTSACESETSSSFASVFKHGAQRATKAPEAVDGQRKAPMLVLTSAEKRKTGPVA
jgi:hypothetical protein